MPRRSTSFGVSKDGWSRTRHSIHPENLTVGKLAPDDTNSLFEQKKVPVMLMEQRIGPGKKLGRQPTIEDRLTFGRQLIAEMGRIVLG